MRSTLATAMTKTRRLGKLALAILAIALLALLVTCPVHAQRTRPGTDVGAGEKAYALILLQDRSIVFYAVYDSANTIRAYVLWNDADSVAVLHAEFASGDPIELTAQPGTRAGARVLERGYSVVFDSSLGALIDPNVVRSQLVNERPVAQGDRDRGFPIPDQDSGGR